MRLLRIPTTLVCGITLLLTASSATPLQKNQDSAALHDSPLVPRCENPCGWSGQLCCAAGEVCYTDANNEAQCGSSAATVTAAAGGSGYWETYTSTWVETDLVTMTSVYSSYVSAAAATATAASTPQCDYAAAESPCGSICCASGQYCAAAGQCADAGNGGYTTAAAGGTYSAPLRPTTGTYTISTATVSPTTTVPFGTPVATGANVTPTAEASSGGGGGLSGGAIAGIVIGVLVGLALLALLCFCCIVRGLWGVVAGIFGLNKRKTRVEETYISEHHEGGSGGGGRVWYGDRPARPEREKKSGFGGWGAVAGGLAALGIGLAGKRAIDKRKDRRSSKSEFSSDYYSDYYYSDSSPSSASSQDRRTRRSSRR